MLARLSLARKKRGLTTHLGREASRYFDRLFRPVDRRRLVDAFRKVGLEYGATVCVHSSLSRLGYVAGGADGLIDALIETVGPSGCILMPTFPTAGSMASYLDRGEAFDVRRSPSRVGHVTEVFRNRPDVLRSLHPTNALAAWGQGAGELLHDHERSSTPFGPATPYGRLAERDDTFVLMIETHVHSLLHHLQERVQLPNLFLPGERDALVVDSAGQTRTVRTRVMRPVVPYFVAIPCGSRSDPDWAILHDFALMFPRRREREVRRLGYRFDGYPKLRARRSELERAGTLRAARVGSGEIGLLHVRPFLSQLEPEFRELIERFRRFYDPDYITELRLPYS